MDEDISIINNETRKEKIINFFLNNKKKLISIIVILVLTPLSFYSYQIYKAGNKEQLADKYNSAVINYENGDKSKVSKIMKEIDDLDVNPSLIQPVNDIKSLGKFKVNLNLHSEVLSQIYVEVVSKEEIK